MASNRPTNRPTDRPTDTVTPIYPPKTLFFGGIKISKCHNSVKNHGTTTGVQHAQLGMLIYNPAKFHKNPTEGYGENDRTNFQSKKFKVP